MSPGPFDITYDQIQRLGPRFTVFVNKLLEVEVAHHGISGRQLTITHNENAPDGGVDAALRDAPGSNWIPAGTTAFQFKRGTQSAADCANELAKESAAYARGIIKAGGNYVMALGSDGVPDQNLRDREEALVEVAIAAGLIDESESDRIKVYGADDLARWASEFTALAVDPILEGLNPGAINFEKWRGSRHHVHPYAPDPRRTQQIQELRARVNEQTLVDIRLQGSGGYGKTRLAMEALDDPRFRSLVAYIPEATEIGGGLIESLIDRGRHVILVVDECPATRHVRFVERLDTNPGVKLITIGDVGTARSSGPALGVEALAEEAMEQLLGSFPALWPEARRFVIDHSRGVPGYAIWLAQAVERVPQTQAAELIARNDITTFITEYLPEGEAFFVAAVLALFERVGWDRDLRPQMEVVAAFAGTTPEQLDTFMLEFVSHELARSQGRYRSIDPLPVAIYLAAEGWKAYGRRIVDDLLPVLPDEMLLGLFRRLGQLGRFEPAIAVLPNLLASDGPFGDLRRIEEHRNGQLLTQLGIVLPDEVASHLSLMIDAASLDDLRSFTESRRDMVWTLEKLVWHTRTFEVAADALLRFALAENETFANNATGTWLDLFGSTLPGTAATPEQRIRYLQRVAADSRPEVRLLAVSATEKGLRQHESISVSGEIQGGVLVEPRGTPSSWADVGEYRRALLGVLDGLRRDGDPDVAALAVRALLDAVHPMLDDPFAGEYLGEIVATFRGDGLRELRVDLEHYISLHRRHPRADGESQHFLDAAEQLWNRLPPASPEDELEVVLRLRSWDLQEGELQDRVTTAVTGLDAAKRAALLGYLDSELPAAFELGRALAAAPGPSPELLTGLAARYEQNPAALVGYLQGLVDAGDEAAFDQFLDSAAAEALSEGSKVAVAARGPVTALSRDRIRVGIATLPVRDAAVLLFGWGRNLDVNELAELVRTWTSRISNQDDYNAAVDWVNLTLLDAPIPVELQEPVWVLVALRAEYPNLAHQRWGWARLAERQVVDHASGLLGLVLDLVEQGRMMLHASDEEAGLIQACLRQVPEAGWVDLASRLEGPEGWRFLIQLRGWIQNSVPIEVFEKWIGSSIDRARLVAAITDPGTASPTELATLLLKRFDGDEQISSSLRASFSSGTWTGSWAMRVAGQIDQLSQWTTDGTLDLNVRRWASEMISALKVEHQVAAEREAETGY